MTDPVLVAGVPLLVASVAGVGIAGVLGFVVQGQARRDDLVRQETRAALDAVPVAVDPLVAAITGELQVVSVPRPPCAHLSRLDRADGLRCPHGCDA